MSSFASPEEYGRAGTNPGDTADIAFKGFGGSSEFRVH